MDATDKEIQNTVSNLTKLYRDEVYSQTGVPFSISEDEAKEYLSKVLQEIKASKLHK
jgi:hypothetical protein